VDRWVGRVIQKIDDLQLWDNSVVVFTTDHGISLGEHNRTGKSNINDADDRRWPIYPEISHIPFMIAAPGLAGGRTVDALVQTPDILPTLLDLAGVAADPPEPLHGVSFAPTLRGDQQDVLHEVAITASHLRAEAGGDVHPNACTPVVYTHDWAYAPFGPHGQAELFDLNTDAQCETSVLARRPKVAADLHGKLIGWLRDLQAPAEAIAVFE